MQRPRKHSHKRDAILACVRSTDTHPTADWVFSQLKPVIPDLSLGTVYRNLALFRENGQVRPVTVVNGVERYDANTLPHPHFVCRVCGGVYDVEIQGDGAASLKNAGYTVENCDITYFGVCPGCNDKVCN